MPRYGNCSGRGAHSGCGARRTHGRPPSPGLYRKRDSLFLGVCSGIAQHFDLSTGVVRALAVLLILFTGLWPGVAIYFIAALIMKLEPIIAPGSSGEREFYDSYARSRSDAVHRIKDKFDSLERRLRRMEDTVTSRDYQWERRFKDR